VLLTSSLSAVLAHQAAEQGNGPKAAKLLFATIGGGGIFLIVN
jgi:cytochrome c oxidase subunit 3